MSTHKLTLAVSIIVYTSIMTNTYTASLKAAEVELAECERSIETLEKERARLRQMIAVLRAKLGMDQNDNPKTLTDAILLVLKATREMECITASDVVSRLTEMQIDAPPRSVATILSRLYKERRIDSYLDRPGGSLVAYQWRGPRTKSDAFNAKRTLAELGKRGVK